VSFEVEGADVLVVVVVADDDGFPELPHAARHTPTTSTAEIGHALAHFTIRCTR
jgi:hypothetical protein